MFELGQIVATPGALEFMATNNVSAGDLIHRHLAGDWGDLDKEDKKRNNEALIDGSRIFSSYNVGESKVWVITESDRSSTCLLLPSEY